MAEERYHMFDSLITLAAIILSLVALSKVSRLEREVGRLKKSVGQTTPQVDKLVATAEVATQSAAKTKSKKALATKTAADVLKSAPIETVQPKMAPVLKAPAVKRDVEKALASRWFVWIGGAAIALGGLLFVKYAFDNGFISATLQIILALIFAALLIYAGEWLRRTMAVTKDANYVPAALSAAGLAVAFGAIFASYALYNLISPGTAFVGLGAIGVGALALSLRQGPLIGALGLAGSYVTPTLITATTPNAWTFFPFLLIIMAASFAVLRNRPWWWLGYASIAGSTLWAGLWIHGPFMQNDVMPLGLFTLAFGALSFFAISGRSSLHADKGSLLDPLHMSPSLQTGAVGAGVASLVLALLVFKTAHGSAALGFFAIGMIAVCALAWFKKGETTAGLAAALLTFLVFMGWPLTAFIQYFVEGSEAIDSAVQLPRFIGWMLVASSFFTAFGLFGLYKKSSPLNWAALAAAAPLAFVCGAWLQAGEYLSSLQWALWAGSAGVILLGAAYLRKAKLDVAQENFSAGLLCVGASVAAVFVADKLFESVWLTIAISALALAFAALTRVLPIKLLGPIAAALGSLTAIRLFGARELWVDDRVLPWGGHWPLYGYGIPILLFWFASRILKSSNNLRSSTALEAVSLGLAISLISLELRVLIAGSFQAPQITLLEASTHLLTWLGAGYGLAYRQKLYSSFVSLWGSRILIGVSCLGFILAGLLALNPLVTGDPVEGNAFINALWIAYLAPVVLLALVGRKMDAIGLGRFRNGIGVLALVMLVTFVTLQTKRMFHGPVLDADFVSDAESYAMSAVWLGLAVLLFIAGLRLNRPTIRYAGLAVMILALLKTFGYDLWQLGGLWQIASVMGIGSSLIGIGWLYTRFVRVEGYNTK
jgi:uncharacterized membrane protein